MLYRQVAKKIADHTGMAYLTERQLDFERRLGAAAADLGLELQPFAAAVVADTLTPAQWDVLADHLAVGETYFFREMRTLSMLESHVLPGLAERAESQGRGLRIWSAGCCTGEEPYTLAMMLHRAGLWRKGRENLLLATDLNPRFLHKAREGGYRPWSFRGAPDWLLEYFVEEPGGLRRIAPAIRKMVRFEQLNLAHASWPIEPYRDLDLILCRNVLLYFTKEGMRAVTGRFAERLFQGGWLVTAPAEAAHVLDLGLLAPVRLESTLLFQKEGTGTDRYGLSAHPSQPAARPGTAPMPMASSPESGPEEGRPGAPASVCFLAEGAPAPAAPSQTMPTGVRGASETQALPLQERISQAAAQASRLADAGCLEEARRWVELALAEASMTPALHHLDGVIRAAAGEPDAARKAWRRALYLDPGLLATRYLLLCLEREAGNAPAVATHGRVLLEQLRDMSPDAPAPGTEGLTAGRLRELVEQVLFME
ncbi:protein-glutamate O-methyltransferase CheR [Megalodesulfovibrio paquesii]